MSNIKVFYSNYFMLVNFEKLWFDLKNFFFISSTIHDLFKDKSATFRNLFFL